MSFKYEINGQTVEFDKEPTEADIDEVASSSTNGEISTEAPSLFTPANLPEQNISTPSSSQTSPLNIAERFKYSFGNQQGRRNYLEKRFPDRKISELKSGKLAVDGIPIDPEGFGLADLPGDIVDVSDELVRLSGQMIGALKGSVIAPVAGTIAGGALGRATGQIAVETIGRAFNMQQEEVGQVVKDIALEGAFGGVGEGFGIALKGVSPPAVKFLRNFSKNLTRLGRKTEQTLLNFTGGMQQRNIERLQIRGASNILTKENLSDDALLKVGEQIQSAASSARARLGQAVESGKGIIRNIDTPNIDVSDLKTQFATNLQKAGLLDRNFKPMLPELGKLDEGQKELVKIFDVLKKHTKISPAKALQWRTELDRIIKFSEVGKISITDFENSIAQGLRSGLKNKLISVSDEFAKANENFANFAKIEEMLKGKLDLQRVESFLKNVFTGPQVFEDTLLKLNQFSSPEKTFIPKLRDIVAARDFASTTFRGIRTGIFSGIAGQMFGGTQAILPSLGVGIALSTPRVSGNIIASRQLLNRLISRGTDKTGKEITNISPKLLSSLLSKARSAPITNVNNAGLE